MIRRVIFCTSRALISAAIGCLALGCDRLLHDAQPPTEPIRLTNSATDCFAPALTAIERFYSGDATPAELTAAWDCGVRAIDLYLEHVRDERSSIGRRAPGERPESYPASELREFFQRHILGSVRVTDALLGQVMKLKQALLGGSGDTVTRDELRKAQRILEVFKSETLKILPYMKLITLVDPPAAFRDRPELVAGLGRQVAVSAAAISELFSDAQAPYSMTDAETLLREIGRLYSSTTSWSGPAWLSENVATISIMKSFFVRPPGNVILPNEWKPLIANGGRLFGVFLQYRYRLEGQDVLTGAGLEGMKTAMADLFTALEVAVRSKPESVMGWELMDSFVRELYRTKLITLPLSEATMLSMLRPLIERTFNYRESTERARRGPERGLTLAAVRQMSEDFFGWADMQRMWDEVEAQAPAGPDGRIEITEVREAWARIPSAFPGHKIEVGRLLGVPAAGTPERAFSLSYLESGALVFERDSTRLTMDRAAFTSLNWKRLLIRAGLRGFAADPIRSIWSGITKDEFQEFFVALRPVAVELSLLAHNDVNSWSSTFDESDSMLFSSDGNGVLSFDEGVDLVSFAVSASKMSRVAYRDMADPNSGCPRFENDVFNLPRLELECFERRLPERFASYYSPVPGWRRFVTDLGPVRWRDLTTAFMRAVRQPSDTPRKLESSNIDRMTMMVHYTESIMLRFDRDGDQTLNLSEARLAFDSFRGLIQTSRPSLTSREGQFAAFTYLLAHGRAPEWYEYLAWRARERWWEFNADRMTLIRIVASLQDENNAQAEAAAEAPVLQRSAREWQERPPAPRGMLRPRNELNR